MLWFTAAEAWFERNYARLFFAVVVLGCLMRLAWAVKGHLGDTGGESFYIASALAEGRGFVDAFREGSGPTAHLVPMTPLPAALVYLLFGAGTPAAEFVLTVVATAFFAGTLVLGDRVLRRLGVPAIPRLAGIALVAVFPIQFFLEALQFRVWEGAIAACMLLGMLAWLLGRDLAGTITRRQLVGLGVANAVVFLFNPAVAIATSGMIGVAFLRLVPWRDWWIAVVTAAVIVAAVVVPWGMRNERVLGEFIPLRSGMGLQMAMAYYPGIVDAPDAGADNFRRVKEVNPLFSAEALRKYKELGELRYNDVLNDEARAWMKSHPGDVWRIRLRNLVQFYVPPEWHWTRFTTKRGEPFTVLRVIFVGLTSVIALIWIGWQLLRRDPRYFYVACAVALPSLPYIATYSLLRYRYPISSLLICLAVFAVYTLLARSAGAAGRKTSER